SFLTDVSSADAIFGSRQVLHLVVDNVAGSLELVGACTQGSTKNRNRRNRTVNVGDGSLRVRRAGQTVAAQVEGSEVSGIDLSVGYADARSSSRAGVREIHSQVGSRAENRLAVVGRLLSDGVDFGLNRREFGIKSCTLAVAHRTGGRLRRQSDRAV